MAEEFRSGTAYVQVLPSIKGWHRTLQRELAQQNVHATVDMRPTLNKQAARAVQQDVESLADKVAAARAKEADATGKVRVAEERLAQVRKSGKATAAQVAAAEERLGSARRGLEAAQRATTRATKAQEEAQRKNAEAQREMESASRRSVTALAQLKRFLDLDLKVELDTKSALTKIAQLSVATGQLGARSLGIAGLAQSMVSLGAAVAPAAGALGLLPAVGLAAGAAMGTLTLGLQGFGDALSNLDDPEKFAEAVGKLAPAAREAAVAIRAVAPAWRDLQKQVQQALFEGVAMDIRDLSGAYLPVLRTQLVGMASDMRAAAASTTQVLLSPQSLDDTNTGLANTREAFANLLGAVAPLVAAFRDVAVVGSDFLPGLTFGAGEAAQSVADMVARMRESGELHNIMSQGLSVLGQLGSIAGNVGSILFSVFSAASESGVNLLTVLEQGTGSLAGFFRSAEGAQLLLTVFGAIREALQAASPLVGALAQTLATTVLPAAAQMLPLVGQALGALAPAVEPLGQALASLAPVVGIVAQALAAVLVPAVEALVPVVTTLAGPLGEIVGLLGGALGAAIVVVAPALSSFATMVAQILVAALTALQPVLGVAVDALEMFTPVLSQVGMAIGRMLITAIQTLAPLVPPLASAFLQVLASLLPLIPVALKLITAIVTPLLGLLPTLAPLIITIATAFGQVLPPLVEVVATLADALLPVITELMPVVTTVFGVVASVVSSVLNGVVVPLLVGLVIPAVQKFADIVRWAVHNVILPVWRALSAGLSWVWETVIVPVFDAIKFGVGAVGDAFNKAVDFIRQVWGKIKEIAAKPVNFVIEWVYNKGIRVLWNEIADFLGLGKLPEVQPVKFARGGVVPGYAPRRDVVPALLSPGEGVLVPEATRALGPGFVDWANSYFRSGSSSGSAFAQGGIVHRFADGGIVDTILSVVGDIGQEVIDLVRNPVGWVKSRIGMGDSRWIDMLANVPKVLLDKTISFFKSKIGSLFGGGNGGPAPSGQLATWIRAAIAVSGVPASWFGPLHTLIMRESGGNPRAQNNWDINARRGDPSRGLMQTIGATFRAYRDPRLPDDIFNPLSNIVAGIRYILARYGSIFNVQQAVGATPQGYDSGGWLPPGVTLAYNGTRRPEPVLTPEQWRALANRDNLVGLEIAGRLELGDDGFARLVDGRIVAAHERLGTAIASRSRI
ncbi:hypothetical protein GCM10012275_52710 [Longimycelium tulufanense]|uniref:Transglycosylase SLT domain-containing protein n=1 Tax=Longimycelium tulufanense TaxID=907463 RepID=A0A8J3CJE0_9PSEU|nr:transglycosylase SLT domain-containing protein [Longimycelium tulufanense]GGM75485.1 hypothetical protein GCM10012275_52710 [Longimycelium tulufanense]